MSPEYSSPISLIPYFIIAMRSTPIPNANPLILTRVIRRLASQFDALLIHRLEHRRVHHPAAQQLNPSRVLALPAALPAAEDARDLHIRTRLRERKERRKEPRLHRRTEERLHRMIQRALQIAERDVRIHAQPLHLVKHRRVRRIGGIVAVHLARNHQPQRRVLLQHRPNLHRRGMRAHQQPLARRLRLLLGDHQRVLRIARRDGSAESSAPRSYRSPSRPRAPARPSIPSAQTPSRSPASCGSADAPRQSSAQSPAA